MNERRLYIASCIALVTAAMTFSIRADAIPAIMADLNFTDEQMGRIAGPSMWAFAISILLSAMILDKVGMGRLMVMAFWAHVGGVVLTIFASGFWAMWTGTLLIGLANGFVEGVINPLTATIYRKDKSKFLNILHAWWPGGLVIGGLLGYALTKTIGLDAEDASLETISLGWKIKTGLILIPTIIYGIMILGQKFPETERVTSGISYGDMFKEIWRPLFILFAILMMLTAATELGPDQWIVHMLQKSINMKDSILILVYTSGIMFVLRFFLAGWMVRWLTPIGVLVFASVFSAIGLLALSSTKTAITVFLAATIFGIGKSYFWPTMMGVIAERVPKGGALALGVLGAAGVFSAGWITVPTMGWLQDHYSIVKLQEVSPTTLEMVINEKGTGLDKHKVLALEGANDKAAVDQADIHSAVMTFRWVGLIPCILAVVFALVFLHYRSRGGYRADYIHGDAED